MVVINVVPYTLEKRNSSNLSGYDDLTKYNEIYTANFLLYYFSRIVVSYHFIIITRVSQSKQRAHVSVISS